MDNIFFFNNIYLLFINIYTLIINIKIIYFEKYIFLLFIYFLVYQFILLILMCYFVIYLGKYYFYKLYLLNFYFLFLISILVQLFFKNLDIFIIFDISQIYLNINIFLLSFNFNKIILMFSTTTIQISFFVNLFTIYYLKYEQKYIKFVLLLNLFVFSMIFLLHSTNFIVLFLFWELIGLTSYFLINFYELKNISFKAAFKAFSFNRISDVCLLISLIIYFDINNSLFISNSLFINMYINSYYYDFFFFKINGINLFLFFLMFSIFCKSAQFGFHFWLPDSMEAPAPASALIHSATLVSAGLFLIIKFYLLFKLNFILSNFILLISSITCIFGAIISCVQTDLKRLLAYSTISNCGLLISSCFISNLENTLYLFKFHGLTKSLSFLIVGFLIIFFKHVQDIRYIGYLPYILKFLIFFFFIILFYLSSWFFTPNIVLKHYILLSNINNNITIIIKIILFFSSFFSILYSLKLFLSLLYLNNKFCKINVIKFDFFVILIIIIFFIYVLLTLYYDLSFINLYNLYNIIFFNLNGNYFFNIIFNIIFILFYFNILVFIKKNIFIYKYILFLIFVFNICF